MTSELHVQIVNLLVGERVISLLLFIVHRNSSINKTFPFFLGQGVHIFQ